MKELSREIIMLCPLCGNDQFVEINEYMEDSFAAEFQCSDCKSIYTKEELLDANAEIIDIAMEVAVDDAMKEFEKELKRKMKKWK